MRIARLLIIIAIAISLSPNATSSTQNGNGFSIEQVLSSPFPTELVTAPTGSRIAWVFDAQGKRNVWVAEGPSFSARQLTAYDEDDGQEITSVSFTHNSEWLVFVRGGDENSAGEVPNPTNTPHGLQQEIIAASWRDGRLRRLALGNDPVVSPASDQIVFSKDNQIMVVSFAEGSEPHPLFSARGNNGSPTWSPDGKRLAFVSRRGSHSFIGVYDSVRQSIRYLSPSVDRDSFPRWSPDGRKIAFIRQPARAARQRSLLEDTPDPWAILVADVDSGAVRQVWQSENNLNASPPRIAGEHLLQWTSAGLVFASEMDGFLRLYALPADAANRPVALTPSGCEFEQLTLTPDKQHIIYSSNCNDIDRRHLSRVAVTGGRTTPITSGEGIEWGPVVTGDGKTLFFAASDAKRPAMPQVVSLTGTSRTEIASQVLPRDFPTASMVVPRAVVFKSGDGLDIHGQLFVPSQTGNSPRLPAVIFMHGGPTRQMMLGWHNRYYYHNAYAFNQYLASRGYIVLSINFRAGIGYGRAFREAPKRGARGAAEYEDIVAGAQYLRSQSTVDPSRIGLWGGSYGGFLTALGLARNSDLFAAGVDIHGVHDWSQRISTSPWIDYGDRDAQKIARDSSPMGSVASWRSPVLLIHGDDDRNVAFSQTVELVQKLREQKVHIEQLVFPDEVHDFLLHRHWLDVYKASASFFDRFLRDAKPK